MVVFTTCIRDGDVAAGAYTLPRHRDMRRGQGLPDQVTDEIEAMTAEYDMSDFKPVSFVSAENTNVNSVQFVIKAEGVKQVKEETEELNTEKEPEVSGRNSKDLFYDKLTLSIAGFMIKQRRFKGRFLMKSYRKELHFKLPSRRGIVNITGRSGSH